MRRAAPLAVLALLVAPAAAHAEATITAVPRDRFEPAEVTTDAGERVTFANRDLSVHDVVGEGFRSRRTDPGGDSPVAGAETLVAGRYDFVCSLHSSMKGTLVVRGGTTPPPPPAPEQEPPPPAPDTTPPRLTVRRRGRVVRVTVDEAARIVLRAGGRARTRTTDGAATVRFRLPRRARRIVLRATDAAGNTATLRR
ncbi:MAG TPA: cupredoxin domain-containing protein [Solirubrobacteraceae bacterium]|nr:cupredoxin domain-containing protein [Solirubrobacteraceae bacterium]